MRELREERALSQRALAALAGVAPATILEAEAGRRAPYGVTVRKLAKALEVDVRVLTGCGPVGAG